MTAYGAVVFAAGCLALVMIGTVCREAYRCLALMEQDGEDGEEAQALGRCESIEGERRLDYARCEEKGRGGPHARRRPETGNERR